MTEHEEHEWIPPKDEETILGFGVEQHASFTKHHTTPAEIFANLATGVIMYSLLALVVIIIVGGGVRLFRWVAGV